MKRLVNVHEIAMKISLGKEIYIYTYIGGVLNFYMKMVEFSQLSRASENNFNITNHCLTLSPPLAPYGAMRTDLQKKIHKKSTVRNYRP